MIPHIITNHDNEKIEVISEYDEKCNVMRIDAKLKEDADVAKNEGDKDEKL